MEIPILFEDKNYIIINKPAGLVVHYDGKTKEPNVTDWILEKYPDIAGVGEPLVLSSGEKNGEGGKIDRPGIVHRIDRETSGVLVIARTQESFVHLKKLFQGRGVQKTYHVFVYGTVKKDEDTIDRPIGRSRKDFRLWSAQRFARGELREAFTDYRVLARGKDSAKKDTKENTDVTFVEVKPRTGRTHQIRVHFKAINHPIVCDKLYAPKREPLLGFSRLVLHARSIEFAAADGTKIFAEAPYPEDFSSAVAKIRAV